MPWRRRSATRGSRWRRPRQGRDALAVVARFDPDLIVLDWMLPDVEGIEVGRRLRERGHKNAILFLTAKDAVEHKVEALRASGDDYVTKPFSLAEVVARVHAILRRTAGDLPGDVLRYGDLMLDESRHEVFRGETQLQLTATEFALLRFFLLNPRRVLSRTDPPERMAVRLPRELERRRDVCQLPPPQAGRRGPADDQDGAPGGLHARGVADAQAAVAPRAAPAGDHRPGDRRPRGGERRDVLVTAFVPPRQDRQLAGGDCPFAEASRR